MCVTGPLWTDDYVERWHLDDTLASCGDSGSRVFADLGMKPVNMEEKAFTFLWAAKQGGHFVEMFTELGGDFEQSTSGAKRNISDDIDEAERKAEQELARKAA